MADAYSAASGTSYCLDSLTLFRCNLCRQPLNGLFYLSTCDHAFCKECCKSHFQNTRMCPVCSVRLVSEDFEELGVVGPTVFTETFEHMQLQYLWTKFSADAHELALSEICGNLLLQIDVNIRLTRFMLMQCVLENENENVNHMQHEARRLDQELAALKMEIQSISMEDNAVIELDEALEVGQRYLEAAMAENYQLKQMIAAGAARPHPQHPRQNYHDRVFQDPDLEIPRQVEIVHYGPPPGDVGFYGGDADSSLAGGSSYGVSSACGATSILGSAQSTGVSLFHRRARDAYPPPYEYQP